MNAFLDNLELSCDARECFNSNLKKEKKQSGARGSSPSCSIFPIFLLVSILFLFYDGFVYASNCIACLLIFN